MGIAPGQSSGGGSLRALKLLVVIMGVAIIASVVVIVATIANRVSAPSLSKNALEDLSIAVPDGCVIAQADSTEDRLTIRLDGLAERGCQQIILVDLGSGEIVGRITARPTP